MNEALRNDVVRLHLGGASIRAIARTLRVARRTISRILADHARGRVEGAAHPELPAPRRRRATLLDEHEDFLRETVARYPDITAVRLLEELAARGFAGKYTIVRQRLKALRRQGHPEPVIRFETGPGVQAQMDYSPYTIDFGREGKRRIVAFSYVLSYSRRQYLRFVESEDFTTTIREHVRAFEHMGGVAHVTLYDNMKVVVSRYDGEEPIYNPRFLAFATHYGFRPWACRRGRSQTKGKVERPFDYVEKNLLNARSFESVEQLNESAAWWLSSKADVRLHATTDRRPLEMWEEEKHFLRPLPQSSYDTAEVIYRVVDVEGGISYRGNWYSVPWQYIGEMLPVRVTERELVVYGRDICELTRHELVGRALRGERRLVAEHRPRREGLTREMLAERFASLGKGCVQFLEGLLARRRYGKSEASRILGLLELYRKDDLVRALERALRYGAYGFSAVERILGLEASPRPPLEMLAQESRERVEAWLGEDRVDPRPTSEYQHLLTEDHAHGEEKES